MGIMIGVVQPVGLVMTMGEAELTVFWNDLVNCNRTFTVPIMNQSPAQLPGLASDIQFNGLSLLLNVGLACTTPQHGGLHSAFSLLKYPSLISSLADFRFTNGTAQIDTHKKKVVSDEFGSGAAFLVARTLFQKTQFLDFQTAVAIGLVQTNTTQSRQPDFLAWGPQNPNSIMLLEAKGTQTSLNYAASQITDACDQLTHATVIATDYSQSRVAVAFALMRENSSDATTIYVGDPDPEPKYEFTTKDKLEEVIRRSHYLRVALFTRDSELATFLESKTEGAPSQLEVREIGRKRYFGSSFVMRSESSTVTVFAGLDAELRRALLAGDPLPPSNEAISPRQHRATKRMTTIQNDGTCLDLSMEVNG